MKNKFLYRLDLNRGEWTARYDSMQPGKSKTVHRASQTFIILGDYVDRVLQCLEQFPQLASRAQREQFYRAIDGDYLILFADRASGAAEVVNDKNGKYRLYFSNNGKGQWLASNNLFLQAAEMEDFRISNRGLTQVLLSRHQCDPDTLIEGVKVLPIGALAAFSASGALDGIHPYFSVADFECDYYGSVDACVRAVDQSLQEVFARRYGDRREPPHVLLSGGIDSLVVLHYLKEVVGEAPIPTLTYGLKGFPGSDHADAQKAARYFGARHAEVWVDPATSWERFLGAFPQGDTHLFGNFMMGGLGEYLGEAPVELLAGQDYRLHTPKVFYEDLLGLKRNTRRRLAWKERLRLQAAQIWSHWPFKGRGPALRFLKKNRRFASPETFFDHKLVGGIFYQGRKYDRPFRYEDFFDGALYPRQLDGMDNFYKSWIAHITGSKHTDNLNDFGAALTGAGHALDFPLFDHRFLMASNGISLRHSARPVYVRSDDKDRLLRDVGKIIVRRLMKGKIPAELLRTNNKGSLSRSKFMDDGFLRQGQATVRRYFDNLPAYGVRGLNLDILRQFADNITAIDGSDQILEVGQRRFILTLFLIALTEVARRGDFSFFEEVREEKLA